VKPDAPVTSQAKGLVATGDGFTLSLRVWTIVAGRWV